MDGDSYYSLIFIILGSIVSTLSASVSYLTQQTLNDEIKKNHINALVLDKLRDRYEETINGLFIVEFLLYLISFFFIFSNVNEINLDSILLLIAIICGILFLRINFYGIGIRFADKIALASANIINILSSFTYFIPKSAMLINDILGGKDTPEEAKEEINAVVQSARDEGSIDEDEYRLIKRVIEYSKYPVNHKFTPRTKVFSLKADMTVEEVKDLPELKQYSRIPIWDGENIDVGLKGYVLSRDLLYSALQGDLDKELIDLSKKIYVVPNDEPMDEVLEKFLKNKQHLFAVVDSYGGFDGIVTLEDAMEVILDTNIYDEADITKDWLEEAKKRKLKG
jgi:CBS domain containing-hemolysin-like protein